MNRVRLLLSFLLCICCTSAIGQRRQVSVYIFLGPECPISQQCTLELGELYRAYSGSNIAFYGVVPGVLYSSAEVEEFRTSHHVSFPMFRDTAYELTRRLKATITPQAIVVDADGYIVYSGAIDNSYIALGKKNKHVTAAYLGDALKAIVKGEAVPLKNTTPIGCRIEGINNRHGS